VIIDPDNETADDIKAIGDLVRSISCNRPTFLDSGTAVQAPSLDEFDESSADELLKGTSTQRIVSRLPLFLNCACCA